MFGQAVEVALGLGSNMGDRKGTIAQALVLLENNGAGRVVARAPLYITPPWGDTDQDDFINTCALLHTHLLPQDLLRMCLDIENALGRVRTRPWGPRSIDIDMLYYGDESIRTPTLTLPHPYMLERAFVVVPLADIAPEKTVHGMRIKDAALSVDRTGISVV